MSTVSSCTGYQTRFAGLEGWVVFPTIQELLHVYTFGGGSSWTGVVKVTGLSGLSGLSGLLLLATPSLEEEDQASQKRLDHLAAPSGVEGQHSGESVTSVKSLLLLNTGSLY